MGCHEVAASANDLDEEPLGRRKLVGAPEVSHAQPARCMIALFAMLCLAGCANNVAGTAAVGTAVPTTSTTATTTSTPSTTTTATTESKDTLAGGVTIDELADDLDQAPKVVDGFWTRHWSDFFTGTYTPAHRRRAV
jgi:hypothetical protein